MWTLTDGTTNVATVPTDGIITIDKPPGVKVSAFVNGQDTALHHLHTKAGDTVSFKIKNKNTEDSNVVLTYAGNVSTIKVPGAPIKGDSKMIDTSNLFAVPVQTGAGTMGGAIGGGLGAGLLGGVLGGALLGGNNGGLFGNRNGGAVIDPWQNQANMSLMAGIGEVKAAIPAAEGQVQLALAGAQMNVTNAVNAGTGATIGAISAFESSVMNNLNMQTQMNQKGFSDGILATVNSGTSNLLATKDLMAQSDRNSWAITQAITADGAMTRALIQSIDKTNDSRLITDLSNQVTELRGDQRLQAATAGINVTTTNNINQMQQQQQQQQQYNQLASYIATLAQSIRSTNEAINVGSGVLTANPTNTNTNIK